MTNTNVSSEREALTLALEYLKMQKLYGPAMAYGNTSIDDAIAQAQAALSSPPPVVQPAKSFKQLYERNATGISEQAALMRAEPVVQPVARLTDDQLLVAFEERQRSNPANPAHAFDKDEDGDYCGAFMHGMWSEFLAGYRLIESAIIAKQATPQPAPLPVQAVCKACDGRGLCHGLRLEAHLRGHQHGLDVARL